MSRLDPGFRVSKYKVTNGQYLKFVQEGASAPHFWTRAGDNWRYRGMFSEIPLPLNAPVYVTHAEASAYARWAGKALPTEAQWQRAAHGAPHAASGNFDFRSWDPQAVDAHPDTTNGSHHAMAERIEDRGDLFAPVLELEQELPEL